MRKFIVLMAIGCLVVGPAQVSSAQDTTKLLIATGGTAGTYYPYGGALAKMWSSKVPGVNVTAQTSGASAENVRLIQRNEAEMAFIQADILDYAYNGKEMFKEKVPNLRAMATLYTEALKTIVRDDHPAKSLKDLKGAKISVGAPGSGVNMTWKLIMKYSGLKNEDFKSQYLSHAEAVEQFKDKHIDAIFLMGSVPIAAVTDIAITRPVKIIGIDDDIVQKLCKENPFYTTYAMPANVYKGVGYEVKTLGIVTVFAVSADLKEDLVYKMTKALFDNQPELASAQARAKDLQLQTATQGVSIPFHPGAVKYYKEKGVIK